MDDPPSNTQPSALTTDKLDEKEELIPAQSTNQRNTMDDPPAVFPLRDNMQPSALTMDRLDEKEELILAQSTSQCCR